MVTMSHGMNPDQVEDLGRLLQARADQLRQLVSEVESTLGRTIWEGPDAAAFKQRWWPDHRVRLAGVAEAVHGFGQSALNNASEQRGASDVTSTGSSTGGSAVGGGGQGLNPGRLDPAPLGGAHWGQPISKAEAKALIDGHIPQAERHWYDFTGENGTGDKWYQCTTWAKARWAQMGYDGPEWRGDGGDVASNINKLLGRPDSHVPTVGAIVSTGSIGHVAVVEEIRTGPNGVVQFRCSEMNMGGDGWRDATPDEFRTHVWTTVNPNDHTFAAFPGG